MRPYHRQKSREDLLSIAKEKLHAAELRLVNLEAEYRDETAKPRVLHGLRKRVYELREEVRRWQNL